MKHRLPRIPHHQVSLLMPAFIRGRLDSERQRQMQEHIASCDVCARIHREDLDLCNAMQQVPPDVELLLTSEQRTRNRMQLMQLIGVDDSEENTGMRAQRYPQTRRNHRLRHGALAAGLVAMVIGAALLPRNLGDPEPYRAVAYRTQSSVSPQSMATPEPTYRVVFRSSAEPEAIQHLLVDIGAVVMGEPSATGVYTLAFPPPSDDKILRQLRQMPEIVLAERSAHNDR